MPSKDYPSVEFLRQLFVYDNGKLFWRVRPREHFGCARTWKRWIDHRFNKEAGSFSKKQGRRIVCVKGYAIHRCHIVWAMHNGCWAEEIDHKNRDPLDDRIENLRLATRSQNLANRSRNKNNTSGFKGVSLFKSTGRFAAYITVDYRRIHLGYFDDPEEAHEAYLDAAEKYFGEFAHGG